MAIDCVNKAFRLSTAGFWWSNLPKTFIWQPNWFVHAFPCHELQRVVGMDKFSPSDWKDSWDISVLLLQKQETWLLMFFFRVCKCAHSILYVIIDQIYTKYPQYVHSPCLIFTTSKWDLDNMSSADETCLASLKSMEIYHYGVFAYFLTNAWHASQVSYVCSVYSLLSLLYKVHPPPP